MTKTDNSFLLPKQIGVIFHNWHDGMDAIYGVGSLAVAGKPISRDYAQEAHDLLIKCKTSEETRSPGREKTKNIAELDILIELLRRNIVALDLIK